MSWKHVNYHEKYDYGCFHLKNMLQWIRHLFPSIDQVLVTLPHDEIQILICFSRYQTVMDNPFFVVGHCSPSVSMQSFKQSQTCPI